MGKHFKNLIQNQPSLQQTTTTEDPEAPFEWNKTDDGLNLGFTQTVYYDYAQAFELGLDLDAYF